MQEQSNREYTMLRRHHYENEKAFRRRLHSRFCQGLFSIPPPFPTPPSIQTPYQAPTMHDYTHPLTPSYSIPTNHPTLFNHSPPPLPLPPLLPRLFLPPPQLKPLTPQILQPLQQARLQLLLLGPLPCHILHLHARQHHRRDHLQRGRFLRFRAPFGRAAHFG